jgi:hypothetical protein
MRKGVTVEVSSADRVRLAAIVADRNSAQKQRPSDAGTRCLTTSIGSLEYTGAAADSSG